MTADSSAVPASVRRIAVVGQPRYTGLAPVLDRVLAFARNRGIDLVYEASILRLAPAGSASLEANSEPVELVLTLGGDGTLLHGARLLARAGVPVLGVNLGFLGVLTAVTDEDLEPALERFIAGEYLLDERFTLEAAVVGPRGEAKSDGQLALNDVLVHKGESARVVRLAIWVGDDEEEVGSFVADGVIIATPTGSTAYSLAAGGPIIVPSVDCIVITPVCPHTLAVRPLVVPADEVITVQGLEPRQPVFLHVDGREGPHLEPADKILVSKGEAVVPLVRFPGQTFFSTLRRKLNWAVPSQGR